MKEINRINFVLLFNGNAGAIYRDTSDRQAESRAWPQHGTKEKIKIKMSLRKHENAGRPRFNHVILTVRV